MIVPARYQERLDDTRVQCRLCPHHCTLQEGQEGICGTRAVAQGTLKALHYGEMTGLALDPIEKKPLAHFHPGSQILSIGSWGCNLRCPFCQNAEISQKTAPTRAITPEGLAAEAVRLKPRGNIGVAYTYNEPLTWFEFVRDAAEAVREKALCNVLVSNGFVEQAPLEELLPWLDAINFDLKSYNEAFYRRVLGGGLAPVKRAITMAVEAGVHLEVTMLVLAGENDDPKEFEAMCQWLGSLSAEIPLHLSRAFPRYEWTRLEVTPRDTLEEFQTIAKHYLTHVHLGNLH